jgi:hypothetical protein
MRPYSRGGPGQGALTGSRTVAEQFRKKDQSDLEKGIARMLPRILGSHDSQDGQLRCPRATRPGTVECSLSPATVRSGYGLALRVRAPLLCSGDWLGNRAERLPPPGLQPCPAFAFRKSALVSPWSRSWSYWALWSRKRPAMKCVALAPCIGRNRRGAAASRPTSRSVSIVAFGAARPAITWSCTQR